jgi:hypothetical protein
MREGRTRYETHGIEDNNRTEVKKRKVRLYKVTKRLVDREEIVYFTSMKAAWKEQLTHYKSTGKWEDMEEIYCDFSNRGICTLLNSLDKYH